MALALVINVIENITLGIARWFSSLSDNSRIDTHIHVLTPSFTKATEDSGGDPSGWSIPTWTLEQCVRFCDTIGASFSVLSVTAPGPSILGPTKEGSQLARTLNDEVWNICCQRKGRFGYFASLPDFNDIEGTIEEITHIFEVEKNANGVIVMTSYGDKLVGDDSFYPIWEALNRYSALVMVHPGHITITPEKIGGFLPQPVIDYPIATTRAAMSLIMSGIMKKCTGIDVILSHAGGAFPFLGQRGIGSLIDPMVAQKAAVTLVEAKLSANRFWYDIALSTSVPQLKALKAFASSSHILFGSDFPYAPKLAIYGGLLQYSRFAASEEGKSIAPRILNDNATKLLNKHRLEHSILPALRKDDRWPEPEFGLEDNEEARQAREQLEQA